MGIQGLVNRIKTLTDSGGHRPLIKQGSTSIWCCLGNRHLW